jgi:hypothetical protein
MSGRTVKKLRVKQKVALDGAVRAIANHPEIGKIKVGHLSDMQIYKLYMGNL